MNKFDFSSFPILTTERFNLRQITIDDADEIFILRSDPEINQYLDRPIAKTLDDAKQFVRRLDGLTKNNEAIDWAISFKKDPHKLIGSICLWQISLAEAKAEIGFELLKEYQGIGAMQEVIPVILDYGFRKLGLDYMEGEADPENIKSIKLMEKFGFTYDRKFENTVIYSIKISEQKV